VPQGKIPRSWLCGKAIFNHGGKAEKRKTKAETKAEKPMVEINHNENDRRYEATVDGRPSGFCQYEIKGDTVTFTHTVVEPEFEGQGVGSALAKFVLEDSRAQQRKVVPVCEFIGAYIRRHGEYKNLVTQ
jgi:predicted GNAT family acetyltransferase